MQSVGAKGHADISFTVVRDELPATIAAVEEAAERGYAVDDEETSPGVMCFGVARKTPRNEVYGISATFLKSRVTPELREAIVAEQQRLRRDAEQRLNGQLTRIEASRELAELQAPPASELTPATLPAAAKPAFEQAARRRGGGGPVRGAGLWRRRRGGRRRDRRRGDRR